MSRRIFTRISGREQISSAVPAELAEKTSDSVGDRDEALRERALDDLVEKMMDGKDYRGIGLPLILNESDSHSLMAEIAGNIFIGRDAAESWHAVKKSVEKTIRYHFEYSHWLDIRERELAEEETEAQKERMGK